MSIIRLCFPVIDMSRYLRVYLCEIEHEWHILKTRPATLKIDDQLIRETRQFFFSNDQLTKCKLNVWHKLKGSRLSCDWSLWLLNGLIDMSISRFSIVWGIHKLRNWICQRCLWMLFLLGISGSENSNY
jgi:hypothetical protein